MTEGAAAHLFKVAGTPMPICSIQYQGVTAFSGDKLTTAAKELLTTDYSRLTNRLVVRETIISLYRQNGFLKIQPLPINAKPEKNSPTKCQNGATLILNFNEGIAYKWKLPLQVPMDAHQSGSLQWSTRRRGKYRWYCLRKQNQIRGSIVKRSVCFVRAHRNRALIRRQLHPESGYSARTGYSVRGQARSTRQAEPSFRDAVFRHS